VSYQPPHKRTEGRRVSQCFCDHCKRPGHAMEKCYKLHGYYLTNNLTDLKGEDMLIMPGVRWKFSQKSPRIP